MEDCVIIILNYTNTYNEYKNLSLVCWKFYGFFRNSKWDKYRNQLLLLLEKFPDNRWNWGCLATNPNLTIKFIEEHLNYKWNWHNI